VGVDVRQVSVLFSLAGVHVDVLSWPANLANLCIVGHDSIRLASLDNGNGSSVVQRVVQNLETSLADLSCVGEGCT
jgi:hypothetical protein